MKKVVKVSIGNVAFVLEEDAYVMLNNYLKQLTAHYISNESGAEIVDGIEERIADLIMERTVAESVVAISTIREIIGILGMPQDIDDDSTISQQDNNNKIPRRLYRNINNKMLGGVLAGIASYFKTDTVWVRLIYIGLIILSLSVSENLFPWLFLGYFIMWIIVPAARTLEQKYAMNGEATNLKTVQRQVERSINGGESRVFDNILYSIGRVLLLLLGIISCIVGVTGLIVFVIDFVMGKEIFYCISFLNSNFVADVWTMSWVYKTTFYMSLFLPFVAILYVGMKLLFGFKSPKWRPGMIIFFLWLSAFIYTVGITIGSLGNYIAY
ncbi:MAG: PspC domain-containing protein [Culturomica sp.]|jgi:phage shock protein PspC (stress-responsive transcriptional regulator)|nr:PspC domain-containing protein [Culturomica sp.]